MGSILEPLNPHQGPLWLSEGVLCHVTHQQTCLHPRADVGQGVGGCTIFWPLCRGNQIMTFPDQCGSNMKEIQANFHCHIQYVAGIWWRHCMIRYLPLHSQHHRWWHHHLHHQNKSSWTNQQCYHCSQCQHPINQRWIQSPPCREWIWQSRASPNAHPLANLTMAIVPTSIPAYVPVASLPYAPPPATPPYMVYKHNQHDMCTPNNQQPTTHQLQYANKLQATWLL